MCPAKVEKELVDTKMSFSDMLEQVLGFRMPYSRKKNIETPFAIVCAVVP
jgi:hypothetical protein